MKVIPHHKIAKQPKPYKRPKPLRYAVQKYVSGGAHMYWHTVEDHRFAFYAKYMARLWEKQQPHFYWRVVDTKGKA